MKRSGFERVPGSVIVAMALFAAAARPQEGARFDSSVQNFEKQGTFGVPGRTMSLSAPFRLNEDPPPGTIFDILSYRLELRAAMVTEDFGGSNVIALRLLNPADSIELYQLKLQIDSVHVEGNAVQYGTDDASERLVVHLGSVRQSGDTVHIAIWYRRLPGIPRETLRLGYNYFSDTLSGLPAPLGYTMSEPREARCWMPCYDEPWDKATAAMNVTVPAGFVAASNGTLDSVTSNVDGTITWHWRESHQIATYLMCATISKFTVPNSRYVRASGDTIPVQYYVWARDSLETSNYLSTVKLMIANLSALFGPYPWDKYGMSCVTPFAYGGMEHQSMTTLHEAYRTNEDVVVHELAHQWWGDLVTCGTWPDIWLNESFATYSEALWHESRDGKPALHSFMSSIEDFNAASWRGKIYDPESQGFGLFPASVYTKGAWVLHTLRGMIGDSLFFGSLRKWRARYAQSSAVTEDLRSIVESEVGHDLSWFFDEWIYGDGWPIYSTAFRWANDTLFVTIVQQQSAGWPVFRVPLVIGAYTSGAPSEFMVIDSLKTQTIAEPWGSRPDSIVLDPEGWVLKQLGSPLFAPGSGSMPARFILEQNYPNPFNPVTVIPYEVATASAVSLEIFDLLGRRVSTPVSGPMRAGLHSVRFDGSGLATGVYLYRLQAWPLDGSAGATAVKRMVLIR
jgi:aminopeptidase N